MKDEIKEILKLYKNNDIEYYNLISNLGFDKLLNYINNLQEGNERLKEWKEDLLNENIELENIRKEAIEYINHSQNYAKEKNVYVNGNDLLNILQGVDY